MTSNTSTKLNGEIQNQHEEPLADYDEDFVENQEINKQQLQQNNVQAKGSYVSHQSAGFRDFLLKPELVRAIGDCGFEHPSEVQQECIPHAMYGLDLICQAKSGMGKTAVFVLSVLQQLETESDFVHALVLCHARELAFQICQEFERFGKHINNFRVSVLIGGVPEKQHILILKEDMPQVVVGTPGRVASLINQGELKLDHLKCIVFDECDRMLDAIDMRKKVQEIFTKTPPHKQVMMFSATIPPATREVCRKFAKNPVEIFVDDESRLTLHGLQQYFCKLNEEKKTEKLIQLLDDMDFNQVVIFVKSRNRANQLNSLLESQGFPSLCIYGGTMTQDERIKIFRKFKKFEARILVSTDLFGRGVDIEHVNIVINYDMSNDDDSYLHRVGRAGRFGTKGVAITFISSSEDTEVLNKVQKRFEVNMQDLPDHIDSSTYMTAS